MPAAVLCADHLDALAITPAERCALVVGWSRSLACRPASLPDCLAVESLLASARYCQVAEDVHEPLARVRARVAADPALTTLLWHGWYQLAEDGFVENFSGWPAAVLGDETGLFYLILGLGLVPRIRDAYARLGVPEPIIAETCLQLSCFEQAHRAFQGGRLGLQRSQLYWLRHYRNARLFRLGRLEFRLKKLDRFGVACRHRATGEIRLLCADNTLLTPAGWVRCDSESPDGVWRARLAETESAWRGVPLNEHGFASREEVKLLKAEWECILRAGDWILDLHIPGGGGMTPEACTDSFRRAFEWFDRFAPETPAPAIACVSWLFNPAWRELLPTSNMVKLMERGHVYPAPGCGVDGFAFVFGPDADPADRADLPRASSLQSAMLGELDRGHPLRLGGWFLLREEVG